MHISKNKIEDILNIYFKDYWALASLDVKKKTAIGYFNLPKVFIDKIKFEGGPGSINVGILCLNQISFVAFESWIENGYLPKIILSYEDFLSARLGKMFIVKERMKTKLDYVLPNKFSIEISLLAVKKTQGKYYSFIDFNVDRKSYTGRLMFALT